MDNIQNKKSLNVKLGFRIIISGVLILWLFSSLEWAMLGDALEHSLPFYLLLAFLAIQLTVLSSVWKWKMLTDALLDKNSGANTTFSALGRLYYIGLFFNNFLPSSIGGDVVRVFQLGRGIGIPKATASVAMERLTSGAALIGILLFSALFFDVAGAFMSSIFLLTSIFLLIFLSLWFLMKKSMQMPKENDLSSKSPIKRLIAKVKQIIYYLGKTIEKFHSQNWKWWLIIALFSVLFQIGMVWINDLLFQAFHIDVPWIQLLLIITLISALTMLPISINGLGVREVGYVLFFKELGVPGEVAAFISLLFFVLVSLSSLLGGLFWLMEKEKKVRSIGEQMN